MIAGWLAPQLPLATRAQATNCTLKDAWVAELAFAQCLLTPADQVAMRQAVVTRDPSLCPPFYRDAYLKVAKSRFRSTRDLLLSHAPSWPVHLQPLLRCCVTAAMPHMRTPMHAGTAELSRSNGGLGQSELSVLQGRFRGLRHPMAAGLSCLAAALQPQLVSAAEHRFAACSAG